MFYIKKINIKNFRCFYDAEFKFSDKINIIYGKNAVGKTSLVEAIYVLGTCKSHRTNNDENLLGWGREFYIINGQISNNIAKEDEIKIFYNSKGKKIILNEKTFKNLSDYIGYFKPIIFCPEDVSLITGSPKEKRRFLDLSICLIDKKYMNDLIMYKKILKQRNEYLKSIKELLERDEILLKTYSDELIRLGVNIIKRRKMFFAEINDTINEKVSIISGGEEKAFVEYKPNCDIEDLKTKFNSSYKNDLILKTTTIGPHKDSFVIEINNNDSCLYASQGQQKTLILSLKLALSDVVKKYDNNVVIILDDVFGELDKERQNNLIKLIEMDSQIFITTTNIDELSEEVINKSEIIKIEKDGN